MKIDQIETISKATTLVAATLGIGSSGKNQKGQEQPRLCPTTRLGLHSLDLALALVFDRGGTHVGN